MGEIFNMLVDLGVTSLETREKFSDKTRDNSKLTVWRDVLSGVIYIDDFYVGSNEYELGEYRDDDGKSDFEAHSDAERRINAYKQFYTDKRVCDVGCGAGLFLNGIKEHSKDVCGVELQQSFLDSLQKQNIKSTSDISSVKTNFDSVFLFHSLEHFQDPVTILEQIIKKMSPDGKIIIEVPHANDFLIKSLNCSSFIDFTLWSQHLILYTRETLTRLLKKVGFKNIIIEGVQRYPLSNHLTWLSSGKPGGHKSLLSALDTPELKQAYEKSLANIDQTDTIVVMAEK